MSTRWHGLLTVAVMAMALWSASANLEENQDLAESQFQPKEVLKALSDAQHSMLADLEEYRNSTKGTRGGGSSTETMTTSSGSEEMPTRAPDRQSGGAFTNERPVSLSFVPPETVGAKTSVRLNIRVDLVLVGFQGDGGDLLDIPQETLELWLEHLTSVVPHATVADHASASASQAGGGEARGRDASPAFPRAAAEVEYDYRYHVVNVDKRVRDAVEAHMRAYLRDEEEQPGSEEEKEEGEEGGGGRSGERPTAGTGNKQAGRQMYMPSWHMEELLSSLAVKLRASGQREKRSMPAAAMVIPAAFTLFVLNPRPAWVLPREHKTVEGEKVTYGYRCGLSSGALAALAADQEVVQRAEKVERLEQKRWRIVHGAGTLHNEDVYEFQDEGTSTGLAGGYDPGSGHLKHIEWTDGKDASYKWARERLAEPPSRAEQPDVDQSGETLSWSLTQQKRFLLSGDPDVLPEGNVRALLRDVLEEHRRASEYFGDDGFGARTRGGTSGRGAGACLTDTWVSGERFAWVDLQAGPFSWGPAAGGDGYKSAFSGLAPVPKPLVNPPGLSEGKETRKTFVERRRQELVAARKKLSARVDRLLALREQMACDEEAGKEPEHPKTKRGRAPRKPRGAVAVACEEVLAQLTFVRQFQAHEKEALDTADAAEAAEAAAVAERGGSTNETFVDILESLRSGHVFVLEDALAVLAPATESDHERRGSSFARSTAALSVDSQALLSRLASLVSSLSRGVVTPASTLPLPVAPPDAHSDATRRTSFCGKEGSAGWPRTRSGSGYGNGVSSACSSPYRLPLGPALMQPRGSGIGATATMTAAAAATAAERWATADAELHRLGATAGAGVANAAHPPFPSALEFFIPDTLEFTLYVVSVQDVYPPLGAPPRSSEGGASYAEVQAKEGVGAGARSAGEGDGERTGAGTGHGAGHGRFRGSSGFDLPAFQEGAMSLKLPNQKASFTVHQVDSSSDAVLVAALAGATRESSVNGVTAEGDTFTDKRVSIDSASLHHQLKARADEAGEEAGGGGAEEKARRHTRHITILLYSFAGPQSVYVDEMWRARGVGGDTVVVAQSESRRDTTPPLACGGRAVEDDPRNPVRQALAALGSIVGGLVPSQDSWDETRGGHVVHDWRWSMSESPMSPLVPRARFSEIDQDIIYRTHVVRALSASVQLTRAGSSLLLDALQRGGSSDALKGPLLERLQSTRRHLRDVSHLRDSIRKRMGTVTAFDHVVRKLNPLLDASRDAYTLASQLARDAHDPASGVVRQDGGGGATPSGGDQQGEAGILRPLVALVVAVVAAWTLRRTGVPFPGARGPKRLKVN